MELIEGSSIGPEIIQQVRSHADSVNLVLITTNHTHELLLPELNSCADLFPSAATASCSTLWWKTDPEFEIDKDIDNKLLISVAPDGYS